MKLIITGGTDDIRGNSGTLRGRPLQLVTGSSAATPMQEVGIGETSKFFSVCPNSTADGEIADIPTEAYEGWILVFGDYPEGTSVEAVYNATHGAVFVEADAASESVSAVLKESSVSDQAIKSVWALIFPRLGIVGTAEEL